MSHRRRFLAGLFALAFLSVAPLALAPAEPVAPHAPHAPHTRGTHSLADETGLSASIDTIAPATLKSGERLRVTGRVTNNADYVWFDAQVYLSISPDPATTKDGLDEFARTSDEKIAEMIFTYGLFDEIGAVRAGEMKAYELSIPYSALQISGVPGAYHVGVSVLGRAAGQTRDVDADARTDTVISLLPEGPPDGQSTEVVTLIPVTAPVVRQANGDFVDDHLGMAVSYGGRLRNLMDFAAQATPDSLDLVVDPSLLTAIRDMAAGYVVRTLPEESADEPGAPGTAQREALDWLADFDAVTADQSLSLMPYGNPATSELVEARLPRVADSSVRASRRFAFDNGLAATIVDWQNNGSSTRRGLSSARQAGSTIHVVSQDTLMHLMPEDDNGYPPPIVSVATKRGPLTALVTRADIGGEQFDSALSALDFRQDLLAEATVRAISSTKEPTSIIAAPFRWDPGISAGSTDLTSLSTSSTLSVGSLLGVTLRAPVRYTGPVQVSMRQPGVPAALAQAIGRLRSTGHVYVDLLTENRDATAVFDRQLATAASSAWQWQPGRGAALIRRTTRSMASQISQVTVTGPEFVALSGDSGQFPLTVTNGLDVAVTVTLNVVPHNPALTIRPVDPIELEAGQRLDIEVVSRAEGSGLTSVQARLSTTTNDRRFGDAWDFDIRATKIGLAIWIFMGVLGATLFSSAAVRIVKRARAGGFKARGEALR